MMIVAILLLAAFLAFANGANDNGKGVATLVARGVAPASALVFAAVTTLAGSAISFWMASGLVDKFSGSFLTAPATTSLFVAVLLAAGVWVLLATRLGLPVSTTHSLIGGLIGAGLGLGGGVVWGKLGAKVALPLASSPLVAAAATYLLAVVLAPVIERRSRQALCVGEAREAHAAFLEEGGAAAAAVAPSPRAIVLTEMCAEDCGSRAGEICLPASTATSGLQWFACGLVGFARGWNDTPKIAALSLAAMAAAGGGSRMLAFGATACAMALGGLLVGRRVLMTLARDLTEMRGSEAMTASATTAVFVSLASWAGLPVSTTHVATGGIIGSGLRHDPGAIRWRKVGEIFLTWVVTLPASALLGAMFARVLR